MIDIPAITHENLPEQPVQPTQPAVPGKNAWPPLWGRLALAGVMLVSIFMNFFQLGQNGYANLYYASAIRSMLDSWHNFLYVAFDPGGFVSIDKPPLGFWLQAASAKIFGFTPLSIFLPLALILTALEQIHIIASDPSWGTWLIPLIAIPCAIVAVVLFTARLIPRLKLGTRVL